MKARPLTVKELALLRESTDPQYMRLPMPERALVARLLALRATPVADTAVPQLLTKLIDAAWGGYTRPDDDAGILLAVADWMDRLDDVTDTLAGKPVVHRTMQDDLRRISRAVVHTAGIDAAPPQDEPTVCVVCGWALPDDAAAREHLGTALMMERSRALRTPKPEGEPE